MPILEACLTMRYNVHRVVDPNPPSALDMPLLCYRAQNGLFICKSMRL